MKAVYVYVPHIFMKILIYYTTYPRKIYTSLCCFCNLLHCFSTILNLEHYLLFCRRPSSISTILHILMYISVFCMTHNITQTSKSSTPPPPLDSCSQLSTGNKRCCISDGEGVRTFDFHLSLYVTTTIVSTTLWL